MGSGWSLHTCYFFFTTLTVKLKNIAVFTLKFELKILIFEIPGMPFTDLDRISNSLDPDQIDGSYLNLHCLNRAICKNKFKN